MISFDSTLGNFEDNKVYGHHITVPQHVVDYFQKIKTKRVICQVGDHPEWHCAILPRAGGEKYILVSKERRKSLGLQLGDSVHVTLSADESKYGMPMPPEMQEMLYQDPEADAHFHKLTEGKQRSLLFMVAKPKSESTRVKKALMICEYLREVDGKLDFKELHAFAKEFNQRWKM